MRTRTPIAPIIAVIALILCAAIQLAAHPDHVGPDGIAYFDMADAIRTGRWSDALTGTWSPLYSAFLAAGFAVFRPSLASEAAVAHLLQFVLFLASLGALGWLQRELDKVDTPAGDARAALHYFPIALFAWAMLKLLPLQLLTPDAMLSGFYFALAALLLRLLRSGGARLVDWLLLGAVAGLGYLTKTIFLYASAATFLLLVPHAFRWRAVGKAGAAAGVFALFAAPYMIALSSRLDRPTVGDVGALAHAWDTRGVAMAHYQGDPAAGDVLVHPTRVVNTRPMVYEFGEPYHVTYPVAYAASYWYTGLARRIEPAKQARAVSRAVRALINGFDYFGLGLIAIVLICGGVARNRVRELLLVGGPMIVVCGLYMLTHVEPRYLAFPVMVGGMVLLWCLRWTPDTRKPVRAVAIATSLALLAPIPYYTALDALKLLGHETSHNEASPHPVIARALNANGVPAGSRIAVVGQAYGAYWARLAGVRIVAEVAAADAPLLSDMEQLGCAIAPLRELGIAALVTAGSSVQPAPPGAVQLGYGITLLWRRTDPIPPCIGAP